MKRPTAGGRRWRQAFLAGAAAAGAGILIVAIAPERFSDRWREALSDRVLAGTAGAASDGPLVVDIDADALARFGPWPWPRDRLAEVLFAVARGLPRAVGVDIILEGPDRASPASLARALSEQSDDPDLAERVAALPDPDEALRIALFAAPTVLGFLIGGDSGPPAPALILVSGPAPALAPWGAEGATVPHAPLGAAAASLGSMSLEADADGIVRRVPLLTVIAGTPAAGLAAELVRHGKGAGSFIIRGDDGTLAIGSRAVPLPASADLRIRPSGPSVWAARTIPVGDLLDGRVPAARLEGRIVLLGGSAPALGGLRATAASPVAPSVQIQADAVATLSAGVVPYRPAAAGWVEAGAALGLGLAGSALGASLGALAALAATAVLSAVAVGGAVAALLHAGWVIDGIGPALSAIAGLLVSGTTASVLARRAAARLRRRFEQHLDPGVVARIAERPDLVKLDGERREVTALFTDIEGFTAVTERIGPAALVRLLDAYFEGVVGAVVSHGGMVDKIVGDAVHALFNVPLDLPDHPRRAVEAALAIARFSEDFRRRPEAAAAGLGRTRIGVETGEVVVGDVGAGSRLDYTAHGSAVNTAARLEAANKDLGSTICVGPLCRERVGSIAFRDLGVVPVRGRGTLAVFEPLPPPER